MTPTTSPVTNMAHMSAAKLNLGGSPGLSNRVCMLKTLLQRGRVGVIDVM